MSNSKILNIFEENGQDEIYQYIKNEEALYCAPAKQYWQTLYEKYYGYLDDAFVAELRCHFFERIWELTQISFLESQLKDGDKLVDHRSRKRKSPDFCMEINGKRYYYETTAPGPGNVIELNETWEDIQGKARMTPVLQYKERICSAIKEKAHDKYFGKMGYQEHMEEDSGLIVAVSMAGIPLYHSPGDHIWTAASCVLGISHPKIDIRHDRNGIITMSETYHDYESTFIKAKSASLIKTDYFCDDKYNHISAILFSYNGWVFFPDADKCGATIFWQNECRNDYLLIHNPFAKVKLPPNYFSVAEEIYPVVHCKEVTL